MAKTRFLHVVFSEPIQAYDIPKFRAAVIEKTKREYSVFHNHLDENKYIYRYPLIQYKVKDKKASIVCLADASEYMHNLLSKYNFEFRIGNKKINYSIEDVLLKYEQIQTMDQKIVYNLHNWIALNQYNFKEYQQFESLKEKITFLEILLEKHLRIFMEALNVEEVVPLKLCILEIKNEKYIEYKNIFHLTFSLNFKCNLSIPNYIGIGKGVSVGFGIIKRLVDKQKINSKYESDIY